MNNLEKYITQIRGISYKPEEISESPQENYVPILKANNITEDGLDESDLIYIHKGKVSPEQFIRKGDLVVAASSGSKEVVGKHIFFANDYNGSFGAFCKVVRPKGNIHPEFVSEFFKTPTYKRHIKRVIQGANINNLRNEHLNTLVIPEFEIADQIKIATILGRAETFVKQRKKSIHFLDEFLKSSFSKMFGDPFFNPNNFPKDLLKNYFEDEPQNGLYKHSSEYGEGTKILRIDSFYDGKVEGIEDLKRVKATPDEVAKYGLKSRDIVINRVNSREYLGKVGLIPELREPIIFESNMMRFSVNEKKLNPTYLTTLLSSRFVKIQILKYAKDAVNQSSINQQDVKRLEILVPPLDLQNEFATIVSKAEVLNAQYEDNLEYLENLYSSLSQRAFNGRLNLSGVKIDESLLKGDEQFKKDTSPTIQVQEALQAAASIVKHFEKVNDLSKAVNRFSIYFDSWSKLNAKLKALPKLPESIIKAQENVARIQKAFSSVVPAAIPKTRGKLSWDNVSSEQIANLIKEYYAGFHFTSEMVTRFLTEEHVIIPKYYSSEELKKNPKANDADDFKTFLFAALNNENPFLKLEQVFYNAEADNVKLTLRNEDFELIKERDKSDRTGIYLRVVE